MFAAFQAADAGHDAVLDKCEFSSENWVGYLDHHSSGSVDSFQSASGCKSLPHDLVPVFGNYGLGGLLPNIVVLEAALKQAG